ncbi:MAG TPA: Rieske 2Fe-2S domain-containing protein [Pseudomonadales bacterium]|nr:Rieske 2Fe-2S domain-containing protein [Pseudomonadales bacterium]
MTAAESSGPSLQPLRKRRFAAQVPAEGDGGLFTQSWFPICPSYEVMPGQIVGKSFLDGRVVVYRGNDGRASVLSAFCPHVGADLAVGAVVGNDIRCAFHHWEFDADGRCLRTGIGDPAPKNACLFKFPSVEKFGLIWAFNGDEPWWDIPEFPVPEEELAIDVRYDVPTMPVDPWVVCANTPDWQHIKVVHRLEFDHSNLYDQIEWTSHSMRYSFAGRMENGNGPEINYNVGIYGTSIFHLHGTLNGQWYAVMTAFGMPQPGVTQNYFVLCVQKGDGSPESNQQIKFLHDFLFKLGKTMTDDDRPILHTIKYSPGTLTRSDRALARYLEMVRKFPRAHPSADFIK